MKRKGIFVFINLNYLMVYFRQVVIFWILGVIILGANTSIANNLTISNTTLTGQSTLQDFTLVQFDISWENSWRINTGPSNWDAAWVFVKYRVIPSAVWNHATLHYVDGTGSGDGHNEPANCEIASANDNGGGGAAGVFIYRDGNLGQGAVNYTGVKLRWDYGIDGVGDSDSVEVCVVGIEMVYVPQGAFFLGDGTTTNIKAQFESATSGNPFQITSESAIALGGGVAGSLGNNNGTGMSPIDDFDDTSTQTLPSSFPKGYDAFYCMKYEVSQHQYVAFLNKLDATQAANRAYLSGGNRNGISGTVGNYTTSLPYVACNFLSWADLAAYLDWAALRPMTELEFEKACRGTLTPIPNEYAWGNTSIATSAYTLGNSGANNEGIVSNFSATAGNVSVGITDGFINGPLRVGIFAANPASTGRVTAGASYYGIMELSGNLWERPVTIGNVTGRAFDGRHGNGTLDSSGNANVLNWPGITALGVGFRGSNWSAPLMVDLRISDRSNTASISSTRLNNRGGRGVRYAP